MNSDILGALKSSIARGQSIPQAMQILLNTGYPQSEIQEAAKFLESGEQLTPFTVSQQAQLTQQDIQPVKSPHSLPQKAPQKASAYEQTYTKVMKKQTHQNQEKGSKILVITLVITLAILLGALIAIFLFKDQIISLFSG